MAGTNGNDVLTGTGGDDFLEGLAGDDTFVASAGFDQYFGDTAENSTNPPGSPQIDRVRYPGSVTSYSVAFSQPPGAQPVYSVYKPDGSTDQLYGITNLYFEAEGRDFRVDDLARIEPIDGTTGNDVLFGTRFSNLIQGLAGADVIVGSGGDDVIYGFRAPGGGSQPDADYDQVNYAGSASDYAFTYNADGSVTVNKRAGTDTVFGIEGVWFAGEQRWYAISDLASGGRSYTGTGGNDTLTGSTGDDSILGGLGDDIFIASPGNDSYDGANTTVGGPTVATPDYNQVNYSGARSDYTITVSGTSVSVFKPDGSTDTLLNIDGLWFQGSREWVGLPDRVLPVATEGDDVLFFDPLVQIGVVDGLGGNDQFTIRSGSGAIDGGGSEYDQVNYPGQVSDYRIRFSGAENRVFVEKPGGEADALTDIDGIWFEGEQAWYALRDLVDGGDVFGTAAGEVFRGSGGDDFFAGGSGRDVFVESAGNNTIFGGFYSPATGPGSDSDYDQVNYNGASTAYQFRSLSGARVEVARPDGGTDTLHDIQGVWFAGDQVWMSIDDLVARNAQQSPSFGLADAGG